MHRIVKKEKLAPQVKLFEIEAPFVARRHKAGQFIILRIDEKGERVPFTVADKDPEHGTITIIIQEVGKTTVRLGTLEVGDVVQDVVGPLGKPTPVKMYGTVAAVGGGIGIAPLYPIGKAMKEAGNQVISIVGARTRELLILEEEMASISDELYITTDDGSYGKKGFVTSQLQEIIHQKGKVDLVVAVGPAIMMKMLCKVTEPYGIKTLVSLNSIMIDGTGMCGGCRIMVGGETRFTCVDGPEFDGHQVDFDELVHRLGIYLPEEKIALEDYQEHLIS